MTVTEYRGTATISMSNEASTENEPQPWWFRFFVRHEKLISFLLFGVLFLGLGGLLTLGWVGGLIWAVVHREWQVFADFLFGIWIPGMPWAGIKWLREQQENKEPPREAPAGD